MNSVKQDIDDACVFVARFLAGERGFTTADVLAGISRLRELHRQSTSEVDRSLAMQYVRRSCEKLNMKNADYVWACGN